MQADLQSEEEVLRNYRWTGVESGSTGRRGWEPGGGIDRRPRLRREMAWIESGVWRVRGPGQEAEGGNENTLPLG